MWVVGIVVAAHMFRSGEWEFRHDTPVTILHYVAVMIACRFVGDVDEVKRFVGHF
jgi:hypothetical protein